MEDLKLSDDFSVGYIKSRGAAIQTGISAAFKKNNPEAPAKRPKVTEDKMLDKNGNIAYWGSSNTFPQDVVADAEKDPFIYPLISRKIRMLYGRGIEVGIREYDDNGKPLFLRGEKYKDILAPVHEFHRNSGIRGYLMQAISDFYWFHNIFPWLFLNNKHDRIVSITEPKAAECRWSVRKGNQLVSDTCYMNSNWGNGADESNSIKASVVDPFYFPEETVRENKNLTNFIYPMSFPDPMRHYYSLAPWNVYRTSKWSEFVQKIPAFKVAMMTNAMLLRWHVKINSTYWTWRFKEDWKKSETDMKLRKQQIDTVFAEIDEMLTGAENAGKAIYTHVVMGKTGESIDMIQITKLDDNLKLGEISEDSAEASSFAIFSFELHPTLVGHAPGSAKSALGAGSGSDQRVAWNNYLDQCGLEIDMILNPLFFIRDFNKWDPRITWRFAHNQSEATEGNNPNKEPQQQAS